MEYKIMRNVVVIKVGNIVCYLNVQPFAKLFISYLLD